MKTCSQSAMERGSSHRDEIRKGPWKAEEDEVLLNHVRRYGPRDWSSIRSKGLLQRTGKSCRLRWVNKLRPNLKKYVIPSSDSPGYSGYVRWILGLYFLVVCQRVQVYAGGREGSDRAAGAVWEQVGEDCLLLAREDR